MKYLSRFMYVIVAIMVVSILAWVFCNLLRKEPKFSELNVTSGNLKRIGDLDGWRRRRHLPVWVDVNGAEIKFRLPTIITKDQLASNVGKEINIYTQKRWRSPDEVWHVSGNNKVYYEYKERLARTKTSKPFFVVIELFLALIMGLNLYSQRIKIKKAWNGNYTEELASPDDNKG